MDKTGDLTSGLHSLHWICAYLSEDQRHGERSHSMSQILRFLRLWARRSSIPFLLKRTSAGDDTNDDETSSDPSFTPSSSSSSFTQSVVKLWPFERELKDQISFSLSVRRRRMD